LRAGKPRYARSVKFGAHPFFARRRSHGYRHEFMRNWLSSPRILSS
jgi:hypothetical protein